MKRSIILACGLVLAACSNAETDGQGTTPSAGEVSETSTDTGEPDGSDNAPDTGESVQYYPTISKALALGNAGPPTQVSLVTADDINVDEETRKRLTLDFPFSLEDLNEVTEYWEVDNERVSFDEATQDHVVATAFLTEDIRQDIQTLDGGAWETTLDVSQMTGADVAPDEDSPLLDTLGKADEYWFAAMTDQQVLFMVYDFGDYLGIVEVYETEGVDPNPTLMRYVSREYIEQNHDLLFQGMQKLD